MLSAVLATAIVLSEFVFERAPFPAAHASTIVETPDGLVAAWFGGTGEGNPDVGIWIARKTGAQWSAPTQVADGAQPDGTRHPCWNPVLFLPSRGPLLLFYKVGPNPRAWWGETRTSSDNGRTWSTAIKLPPGILGPIRAKPVELSDGALLAGSSTEHGDGSRTWSDSKETSPPRRRGIRADLSTTRPSSGRSSRRSWCTRRRASRSCVAAGRE